MSNKILLSVLIACTALTTNAMSDVVLREGYALKLVTGNVTNVDGKWMFVAKEDIVEGTKTLPAGASIELLPSNTLGRIISSLDGEQAKRLRIQGTITKYDGKNYLFTTAFIPLAKMKPVKPEPVAEPVTEIIEDTAPPAQETFETIETVTNTEPAGDEPKTDSVLSDETRNLLGGGWVPDFNRNRSNNTTETVELEVKEKVSGQDAIQETESNTETEELFTEEPNVDSTDIIAASDYNIVSKTGFIDVTGDVKTFKVDTLGRNINNTSYILLPCSGLERFEELKYDIPGRRRYMVSGVVTEFQGQQYLLIQRLVRTYSNGNFAR